jgi:toxin ParE1/3/4
MASYKISNKAVDDLSGIWNYTINTWSEFQADKYYFLLIDCCQNLADKKISGKPYPGISDEILGCRTGEHIIFYRQLKGAGIEIIRILHSRMDLKAHFR